MTGQQYEAFCRFVIAHQLQIPAYKVVSRHLPGHGREDRPAGYELQIDLYWETTDKFVHYVNIANAKWRTNACVGQEDVLLLQKVKEKVAAHKAFLITNSGFTSGAIQVAEADGIGLLVARPEPDCRTLASTRPDLVVGTMWFLAQKRKRPYSFHVITKGFEPMLTGPATEATTHGQTFGHQQPLPPPVEALNDSPVAVLGGGRPRVSAIPPGLDGYSTRQGSGPGFRTK